MVYKNFWLITLCGLLILSEYVGQHALLRVAIAGNAIILLFYILKQIRGAIDAGNKAKN